MAQLNLDTSKIHPGARYNQTYASVVAWEFIMIMFYTAMQNNWKTMQLDYVLNFPQASVHREFYMKIPKGNEVKSATEWVFKANMNIHGQLQADIVWNKFILEK